MSRLPRWQKVLMIFLGIVTVLMLCFDVTLYRAFFYNPQHITTRYETISSPLIPESMDQVSMVFLTDIEYDEATDPKGKMDDLFTQVQKLNPDVLLFGGDLFSANAELTDDVREKMVNWISSVSAPLGKFGVFGEQDLVGENHRLIVEDVYRKSQVELLNNRSVLLANQSPNGIRLGGFDVFADALALKDSFLNEQFSLLLSHYPDNLLAADQNGLNANYALCGNSHGSQIDWPILGGYKIFNGSREINRNHLQQLNFPYLISNGIGCIDVQARLNSPVEIVYLTLCHTNS